MNPAVLILGPYAAVSPCAGEPGSPRPVGGASLLPDGACVRLNPCVVTAVFTDRLYVQDLSRAAGIQARPSGPGLQPGDAVSVSGRIVTLQGERVIEGATLTVEGSSEAKPVGMHNRRIGGEDFCYDPVTGAGQRGIRGAFELNNIGLLVRTWGRVTFAGGGEFYTDDGSGLNDGSGHAGVRVIAGDVPLPGFGTLVRVTGISSCYEQGPDLHRLLRLRSAADIELLDGEAWQAAILALPVPGPAWPMP